MKDGDHLVSGGRAVKLHCLGTGLGVVPRHLPCRQLAVVGLGLSESTSPGRYPL